ncbi:hypothetical protein ATCC90586_005006 [Pythium insidiosum]|nr:hypothetical protein ATCC90586_005006 [Pythium insidiosum]
MELTEDLIKRRSKHFDLGLDGCKSLLHLDLTGNQLRDLSGLPALPLLQSLGLSRNKIRTLALLRDAELTLDHETANVQRAFMLEQALSPA